MTLRKKEILDIERGGTRSHSSLRKRLWTCRKTDCRMNDWVNSQFRVSGISFRLYIPTQFLFVFLISHMRATCTWCFRLVLLNFILEIFSSKYILRNYSLYDFIHTPVTFSLLRCRAMSLASSRCNVIVHTKVQSQARSWRIFDGVSSTETGFCPGTSAAMSFDSTSASYSFFYYRS
jgi:hypothetical protein